LNKIYLAHTIKIIHLIFILIFLSGCVPPEIIEIKLAEEAYKEKKYLTAITYSNKTLQKDRFNYEAILIKGKSNLQLKNYREAVENFSNAIKIKPAFDPYLYRGRAYLELNELAYSAGDFEKAIEYDRQNIDVHFNLAYVKTLMGEYDSALNLYNEVIKLNPLNSNAYVNIGNLKGMMGDSESAIEYFSKAIEVNPNDALAYFNRANEKMIISNLSGAVDDFTKAVEIDSTNINTIFDLADAKIKIKDFTGASNDLQRIIDLDPINAKAYYLKGVAEISMNNKEKACLDLNKAGDLGYFDAYEMIKKNCGKKEKVKKKSKK
jgi:tetratricopeptide (TPR) repeat protein